MARGTEIIVSSPPRGLFREGNLKVDDLAKPGCVMQIDVSAGISNAGQFTYEYFEATDGLRPVGPLFILLPDTANQTWDKDLSIYSAYANISATVGGYAFVYTPCAGEEFNMIVSDLTGTTDTEMTMGQVLMVDSGTGELVATTGSIEVEPFMLLETVAAEKTADFLAHCIYTGY